MKAIPMSEPGESKNKEHSDYELADMANTIMKAHEHMNDPELMKKLQPHLDKKIGAIKSIAQLRKRANRAKMEEASPNEGE